MEVSGVSGRGAKYRRGAEGESRMSIYRTILTLAFAILACALANAQKTNAIILIPPNAVGRVIAPENYDHGLWIRWPVATGDYGINQLLSPLTGFDWYLDRAQGIHEAQTILGLVDARRAFIGSTPTVVLIHPDGSLGNYNPATILDISEDVDEEIRSQTEPIPPGTLILYSAVNWDDAARVAKLATGKSIIVEYPPGKGETLSAAWYGDDSTVPVPQSTHVAGMLPATEILHLLNQPDAYKWEPKADTSSQQWMAKIVETRPFQLISLFAFVLIAAGLALWCLSNEAIGKLARMAICMSLCAFTALLLAGNMAKLSGLMPWNVLPVFAYFGLILGLAPVYLAMRALWPTVHPIYPIAIMSAVLILWTDPVFTAFSNQFTLHPTPVSALAAGGLVAALTATVAYALNGGTWPRILAALTVCSAMLLGVFGHAWWAEDPTLLAIPILAVIAGAGLMRIYLLPVFAAWPFLYHSWNGHLSWEANGLITRYSDVNAINTAGQAQFLLSPMFLIFLGALVGVIGFGGKFLKHELRRAFVNSSAARALLWCALAMACFGLREPYLLPSALVVGMTGCLCLLFDAAGAL